MYLGSTICINLCHLSRDLPVFNYVNLTCSHAPSFLGGSEKRQKKKKKDGEGISIKGHFFKGRMRRRRRRTSSKVEKEEEGEEEATMFYCHRCSQLIRVATPLLLQKNFEWIPVSKGGRRENRSTTTTAAPTTVDIDNLFLEKRLHREANCRTYRVLNKKRGGSFPGKFSG